MIQINYTFRGNLDNGVLRTSIRKESKWILEVVYISMFSLDSHTETFKSKHKNKIINKRKELIEEFKNG